MRLPLRLLAFAALLAGAGAARAAYTHAVVLVPDAGLGMVSEYAGLTPAWDDKSAPVAIPASTTHETNLVWTFWDHTRLDPSEWPVGRGGRLSLTLVAKATVTVRLSSFVRAGNWSAPAAGPAVTLPAGKTVTVLVPVPPAPVEPVEVVRVLLESTEKVPALSITHWSIGEDTDLAR